LIENRVYSFKVSSKDDKKKIIFLNHEEFNSNLIVKSKDVLESNLMHTMKPGN